MISACVEPLVVEIPRLMFHLQLLESGYLQSSLMRIWQILKTGKSSLLFWRSPLLLERKRSEEWGLCQPLMHWKMQCPEGNDQRRAELPLIS
jgi:hypothetical protein